MNDAVRAELEEEEEEARSGANKRKRKPRKESTRSKAKAKDCGISDTEDVAYVASESESELELDSERETRISPEEVSNTQSSNLRLILFFFSLQMVFRVKLCLREPIALGRRINVKVRSQRPAILPPTPPLLPRIPQQRRPLRCRIDTFSLFGISFLTSCS